MTLKEWLTAKQMSNAEFGVLIKRSAEAVRRYANDLRMPEREAMLLIVEATGGEVTANDFFGIGAGGDAGAEEQADAA